MIDRTRESPLSEQKVLCFVPLHNAPNKHDVTGAFLPEAKKFVALAAKGSEIVRFDNTQTFAKRRKEVLKELRTRKGDFTSVAFFCHGWANGIQAGFTRRTSHSLAGAIFTAVEYAVLDEATIVVPLYCCSTGQDTQDREDEASGTGKTSFAQKLASDLADYCFYRSYDVRVVAHTTKGHTTRNPNVAIFDRDSGLGGYLLQPQHVGDQLADWRRAWRRALKGKVPGLKLLRFQFPYQAPSSVCWAIDVAHQVD